MKTTMQKPLEVQRKWYIVDAEGVALGRLASQVASILRGKNKPEFTPNVDCGDHVIVINTDKVVLTGKKMEQKFGGVQSKRDFFAVPKGVYKCDREIWDDMMDTIIKAGYEGKVGFQMDVATDTYHNKQDDKYYGLFDDRAKTKKELYDFYMQIIKDYPFVIIEDPFNEDDYETTAQLTEESGIQIVGDDLFTTNLERVKYGISQNAANAVLLKVNQIGTLSEAFEMIQYAYKNNYAIMPSDSRGEGASIADYAVGINAGSIRESAVGDRGNRFLEIEEELGDNAKFLGAKGLKGFRNQQRAEKL